jgi:hypothetical protein
VNDENITLYHFTRKKYENAIKQEGITLGGVYVPPFRIYQGYYWLTDDPRFEAQHWATDFTGQCGNRIAVRFTVSVSRRNVLKWNDAARKKFGFSGGDLMAFNLAGGSDGERWYLSATPIRPEAIIAIDYHNAMAPCCS